jgi:multimeric flavodoxin WrbA
MASNALLLNCTLKPGSESSNTAALLDRVANLFRERGVTVETVRVADLNVPPGVTPDKQGDGEGGDDFPSLYEKIKACDIFVPATPVWLGHRGSVLQRVLERLDGSMSQTDDKGQTPFFGKVAGCVVTGNEDGAHAVSESTLFNLTHLGFTIPPMVDCYWLGPAGPGNSYAAAGGEKHLYTNKTARYMVAGLTWYAELLKNNPLPIDYNELTEQASAESDSESQDFFGS